MEDHAPKGRLTKDGKIIEPKRKSNPKRFEPEGMTDEEYTATHEATPQNIHIFNRVLRKNPIRKSWAQACFEERQARDLRKYRKIMSERASGNN